MNRFPLAATLAFTLAVPALAEPAFDLVVNPAQSNVNATLTVSGESSSDSSPISGSLRIKLDAASNPVAIELHDFDLYIVQPLDFNIVFRIFGIPVGSIVANAQNVAVAYATPGVIEGPVPIIANEFTFDDVPASSSGQASYTASGTICTVLQAQNPPLACNGNLDLAETGTQIADQLPGSITITGRSATVSGTLSISGPLDPENPSLGSLAISGTFVATGTIPYCPGDFDQNGLVAVPDIFAFLSAWFAGLPSANVDGVPGVTVPDIFAFLSTWFASCP